MPFIPKATIVLEETDIILWFFLPLKSEENFSSSGFLHGC